jgi:hypothetical protein
MPDEDAIEESGGLEPAVDETLEGVVDAPEAAPEPEPEVYTRDQLAELLGPRFARFASHEGEEAFRQYGQAYDSATGLIRQGAHLEPQDPSVYEQIGLDPTEIPQPPVDEGMGIFGAPWEAPQAWTEIEALASSEHLQHKIQAADAVVRMPNAPEDYKEAYWDNAYGQGAYKQAVMQQQFIAEQQESLKQQLRDEILAEIAPVQQAHMNTYVDGMLAQARANIAGFQDHEAGIAQLMQERERRFPGYQKNFDSSGVDAQIAELQELTLIAASRQQPARVAAQQAAADATDAAKVRGRTETNRSNGAPDDTAALKRRVFGQVR